MNCNDCGGFLPGGCECSPFGGRNRRALTGAQPAPAAPSDEVMLNGLTRAETDATASVQGLTAAQPADSAMTEAMLAVVRAAKEADACLLNIAPPDAFGRLRRALAAFDALEKP